MGEVEFYAGVEGATFNVSTPQGLLDALDVLHTQVLDNMKDKPSKNYCLLLLAKAMDELCTKFDIEVGEDS